MISNATQPHWVSTTSPMSIQNVGTETLAMRRQNTIVFTDLKSLSKTTYKADGGTAGAGISVFTGHNRFPLFAFAESILRPSIFVIKYPEMTQFCVFECPKYTKYTNLKFSDSEFLVAITGYPEYAICIWNLRSRQLVAQQRTNKRCSPYSIQCAGTGIPVVVVHSSWGKDLSMWEGNYAKEGNLCMNEITTVKLPKDYDECHQSCFAFTDDGNLYIVDSFGLVSMIDAGQFYLRSHWYPGSYSKSKKARPHFLYSHKLGLIMTNYKYIYFIKKRGSTLKTEWVIEQTDIIVKKIISGFNNDIFATDRLGNVFRVSTESGTSTLVPLDNTRRFILTYCFVKSLKEEAILLLTDQGDLNFVDMSKMSLYSSINVPNATVLTPHNALSFVAVGTSQGKVHFIHYERARLPSVVEVMELELGSISRIRLFDTTGFIEDTQNAMNFITSDLKNNKFDLEAILGKKNKEHIYTFDYLMIDEDYSMEFSSKLKDTYVPYADHLSIYYWSQFKRQQAITTYELLHKYRTFCVPTITNKSAIEFIGGRLEKPIIDIYMIRDFKEITLESTIQLSHFSSIIGLGGSRNLVSFGVGACIMNFRLHRKSPHAFGMHRFLEISYAPQKIVRAEDGYNNKYLVTLYANGLLKCYRLPPLNDSLYENIVLPVSKTVIAPIKESQRMWNYRRSTLLEPITTEQIEKRAELVAKLAALEVEVRNLIDYDISVTGKTHGVFRKFCLNRTWLDSVTEQARILCNMERKSLMDSIEDQSRIRDWIMNLISRHSMDFSYKLRALFTNTYVTNYSVRLSLNVFAKEFDYFRLYELERPVDEELRIEEVVDSPRTAQSKRITEFQKNYYNIQGGAYDHVMAPEYLMQDKNRVTSNQYHNDCIKYKAILNQQLCLEFNKIFMEAKQFKEETIKNILNTNANLNKIHDNMNCMLRLLNMDQFEPEALSAPEWFVDEDLERILTVDDSEIKAINRRKRKAELQEFKGGRMLLWAKEFWERALMIMMDGVLEKLWEEEIKKEPPIPEFMTKKAPHEYSLEDQRQLREYEELLYNLELDRRKYLSILQRNKTKTMTLKDSFIFNLNKRCSEMYLLKLRYDYALKHIRIRLMNMRMMHHRLSEYRKRMCFIKDDIEKINEYINKYAELVENWENSISDMRLKMETATQRDKTLEKQFKTTFLNTIPAHFMPEMVKLFKKRPKINAKFLNSTFVCKELASRIVQRTHGTQRLEFPMPKDSLDYLSQLDVMDDVSSSPNLLDIKHWEAFVKLRRQRIENELRTRGINQQLVDGQNVMNWFNMELSVLKNTRIRSNDMWTSITDKLYLTIMNQRLQVTLNVGQVEVNMVGSFTSLNNAILMSLDDLHAVNALIKEAGNKKLKAMQRVAFFRRKVIYKEWEHKVVRANIEYLKFMLGVIQKCKITIEFLNILRNWAKVRQESHKMRTMVGLIEKVIEQKITAFRKHLEKMNKDIDICKFNIDQMKRKNQQVNKQIDDIKVNVAMATANRDLLIEEKREREQSERMTKIKTHHTLLETVRRDYARILELNTILELQRLRTYPTLGPGPAQCDILLKEF